MTIFSPRWSDDDFEGLVEVSIGGRSVYGSRMLHPSVGEFLLAPPTASLWIRSDTGGSGGYSTTYLFNPDADGAFLPVAVLENGSFQAGVWVQPDVTYRYWLTAGVASPVPVLRALPCQTGLRFLDPTAADAPSAEQLSALKSSIANTAVEDGFSRDLILAPTLRGFLDLVSLIWSTPVARPMAGSSSESATTSASSASSRVVGLAICPAHAQRLSRCCLRTWEHPRTSAS